MTIFLFPLLYQLIFFAIVQADTSELPETISFKVLSQLNEEVQVNLVPAKTFLANENVPVWVPEPANPTELRPMKWVMENLAPFTVYRDPDTCAAALYFHKKKQFEGTVGHHHIIRKLNYNPITKNVEQSENTVCISPLEKHGNRLDENIRTVIAEADNVITTGIKSLGSYPDIIYVEMLVMIHHDITNHLKHDFAAIVTYVLTLFNTVDMLYSKINTPKIKINIAGIIIGTTEYSFPEFSEHSCYKDEPNSEGLIRMDTVCMFHAIRSTLLAYDTLSDQSYDIVVYLTRSPIYGYDRETIGTDNPQKMSLFGRAFLPNIKDGYRQSLRAKGIAIISDSVYLKFFPTVAHEIAHLLSVPHEGGPLWNEDGTCDAHLMKKDNSFCSQCLSFSGKTPDILKEFFGLRESCIFRNEPRSLNKPSHRRLFWTVGEQCQCYGYPSTLEKMHCSPIRHIFSSAVNCKSHLVCVDGNNENHRTTSYMNGTPCDRNEIGSKVCWDSRCVSIHSDNEWRPDN